MSSLYAIVLQECNDVIIIAVPTFGKIAVVQGGMTRVKCHMTFIACQRRARMRAFPLRAFCIMFSSARALLSVSATSLSKPVQC